MANNEAKVNIKGQSDTYDRVLEKIIELNNRLASEVGKVKEELESLNPIYEELAVNANRYANALKDVRNLNRSVGGRGGNSGNADSGGGNIGSGFNFSGKVFNSPNIYDEVINNKSNFNFSFVGGKSGSGGKGLSGLGGFGGSILSTLFDSFFQPLFPFDEVITMKTRLPFWFNPLANLLQDISSRINLNLKDIQSRLPNLSFSWRPATFPIPSLNPVPAPVPFPALNPVPVPELSPVRVPNLVPQLNPVTVPVEIFEPVLSPAWEFLKEYVLKGVTSIPLNLAINWSGLDILENFRVKNLTWHTVVQFFGLEALKNEFMDAVNYLEGKLESIGDYASRVGEAIASWFRGVDIEGFLQTCLKILDILSWVAILVPGLGEAALALRGASMVYKGARVVDTVSDVSRGVRVVEGARKSSGLFGGIRDFFRGRDLVPSYANGGFHVKPHIGLVGDVPEVTLPLNSSASEPAYKGIAENLMAKMGDNGGARNNFTIHLGQNSTIIADDYSFKMFAEKIADYIEYRLRSTGVLSYGAK